MKTPIKTLLAAAMLSSTIASAPAQADPAAPLTRMGVYAVKSSNCDTEYPFGQLATTCDHGGAQLRVFVMEIGHSDSYSQYAKIQGKSLPRSAIVSSTPVCRVGAQLKIPCTPGIAVDGFIYEFKLDGYQKGSFTYQSTSINYPWNTMSTQIFIQ